MNELTKDEVTALLLDQDFYRCNLITLDQLQKLVNEQEVV